ncbi:hypothetical protein M9Y10_021879 [Tritrichomonas musculus]|uniref:COPI associated protein n=1 Tax=Tritrichomonas musculus TaxID=1915356 RepID=A0ABR2KR98_9EUKA
MQASQIIQICAIIVDIFGIIAAIVHLCSDGIGFVGIIRALFTIALGVFLLMGELYIFSFFRYFGFIFKNWGKALAYLFMGAALFANSGFGLFVAIIFWIIAIAYFILGFIVKQVSYPVFQGGCKGSPPPSMSLDSSEIYANNEKQMDIGHKHGGGDKGGNDNADTGNTAPAQSPPAVEDPNNEI